MSTSDHKMPKGISYIIGNEFAERFSFYGMKAILVVFMTKYLVDSSGNLALMSESESNFWYHTFVMFTYFTPLIGAIISDVFLGKYKTIIYLSIVYCLGHLALALDETRLGLTIGLTLIAMGSGGIKPCVSAHVGDQFSSDNKGLLNVVFKYFYLAINLGSVISMLLTPLLLSWYGPHVAFGVPGLLMLVATILFWAGRNEFIAIKPVGPKKYWEALTSDQGKKAITNLVPVYLLVALFWAIFDQTGSALVHQADKMNRLVDFGFLQFELLPSQVQAINPFLVILFIPLFTFSIYPFLEKFLSLSGLRKITIGMFLGALSFVICALVQNQIDLGNNPSILLQVVVYIILTAAEIFVSITALEMAYTQAPNSLKSFIMSFYLLSVALGNFITAFINGINEQADGSLLLEGSSYYWFFAGLAVIAGFMLLIMSARYKEVLFVQPEEMRE